MILSFKKDDNLRAVFSSKPGLCQALIIFPDKFAGLVVSGRQRYSFANCPYYIKSFLMRIKINSDIAVVIDNVSQPVKDLS